MDDLLKRAYSTNASGIFLRILYRLWNKSMNTSTVSFRVESQTTHIKLLK